MSRYHVAGMNQCINGNLVRQGIEKSPESHAKYGCIDNPGQVDVFQINAGENTEEPEYG